MDRSEQYLGFIKELGQLKDVTRTAYSGCGRQESTAEHSWRLAVFAGIMLEEYPGLDAKKVLMMALVHDIGELYDGDHPAITCPDAQMKYQEESAAVKKLTAFLPQPQQDWIGALWQEYEEGTTGEARLVKALDKAETILQHNQGKNPADFDYEFNLGYGRDLFGGTPILRQIRAEIDADTRKNMEKSQKP